MGPHLHCTTIDSGGARSAPDRSLAIDLLDSQILAFADHHSVALRLDSQDISRLAILAGSGDPQTSPLSDGVGICALMLAKVVSLSVDDLADLASKPLSQPTRVIAGGNEADVMAIWFRCHCQSPPLRLFAHHLLGRVTQREICTLQLTLIQDRENVGLILTLIDGAVHRAKLLAIHLDLTHLGIVPRDHPIESHRLGAIEDCCKLDLLIAAKTRIGSATRLVLIEEVLHHFLMEFIGHIPDVERDTDAICGSTCIVRVLDRATTLCSGTILLGILRKREMNSYDFKAGLLGTCCSDG